MSWSGRWGAGRRPQDRQGEAGAGAEYAARRPLTIILALNVLLPGFIALCRMLIAVTSNETISSKRLETGIRSEVTEGRERLSPGTPEAARPRGLGCPRILRSCTGVTVEASASLRAGCLAVHFGTAMVT